MGDERPGCALRFRWAFARVVACLLLGHVLAGTAAQTNTDGDSAETVYNLGPGITPPRVTKQVPPKESTSRGVRVVGSVTVALVISSKGVPRNVHVVKGLDKEVDQNTVEAVEQWRFAPAQKDGKPVAVKVSLEIQFHDM
jgi:periplasmic protein TonB